MNRLDYELVVWPIRPQIQLRKHEQEVDLDTQIHYLLCKTDSDICDIYPSPYYKYDNIIL